MVPAMDDKTETEAKAGAMIVPVTLFEQNCTIIWHEPSKKAVVIEDLADARPYRPCRRRRRFARRAAGEDRRPAYRR
jgi:hypothetical protein